MRFSVRCAAFPWWMLLVLAAGPVAAADAGPVDRRQERELERETFRRGRYVFQKNCVPCHGRFGEGDGELVRGWEVLPRNFRLATFKYRSTPHGQLPTDDDLARTIRRGISGTALPAFTRLREPELSAVIEYLKSLSPAWKDESLKAQPIEMPRPPAWLRDPALRKEQQSLGGELFQSLCASCHGSSGAGDGPAAASLLDSRERPIRPADLRQPLRSGPDPADVYRTIMTGINGTPMMGFEGALKPEQVWQLAAFVLSLAPVAP
jgi:mono/diheme cytochrome c family protein